MGKETILLYHFKKETEQKIKKICLQLGIKVKYIDREQYSIPIGMILIMNPVKTINKEKELNTKVIFDQEKKQEILEEMMVLAGFSDERMDRFFARMKKMEIPEIKLKAVITEYNKTWNGIKLYQELKKEQQELLKN